MSRPGLYIMVFVILVHSCDIRQEVSKVQTECVSTTPTPEPVK